MIDLFEKHWPLLILAVGIGLVIARNKKKKKDRDDFWKGFNYKADKGTSLQKNRFADAMNHIRIKNRTLYNEIDRKLDTVYINNINNPDKPTSLASAPYNGNHINIWKPHFSFPSKKTWVNTIFHEFGHMEGQKHGSDHNRLIALRMKSVGY